MDAVTPATVFWPTYHAKCHLRIAAEGHLPLEKQSKFELFMLLVHAGWKVVEKRKAEFYIPGAPKEFCINSIALHHAYMQALLQAGADDHMVYHLQSKAYYEAIIALWGLGVAGSPFLEKLVPNLPAKFYKDLVKQAQGKKERPKRSRKDNGGQGSALGLNSENFHGMRLEEEEETNLFTPRLNRLAEAVQQGKEQAEAEGDSDSDSNAAAHAAAEKKESLLADDDIPSMLSTLSMKRVPAAAVAVSGSSGSGPAANAQPPRSRRPSKRKPESTSAVPPELAHGAAALARRFTQPSGGAGGPSDSAMEVETVTLRATGSENIKVTVKEEDAGLSFGCGPGHGRLGTDTFSEVAETVIDLVSSDEEGEIIGQEAEAEALGLALAAFAG